MTDPSFELRRPHVRFRLARVTNTPPRASSLIVGLTLTLIVAAALASALHSFAAASPIWAL